jgi:hypothetical protein
MARNTEFVGLFHGALLPLQRPLEQVYPFLVNVSVAAVYRSVRPSAAVPGRRWTGRPKRAENYGKSTDLNRFFSI